MSDKFFNQDDPTQPIRPPIPTSNQGQGQPGKLVVGSFQDQPKRPEHRPHQYPPQQPPGYPQRQPVQPPPPRQQVPPVQPGPTIPTINPNVGRYRDAPPQQPGQIVGGPGSLSSRKSSRRSPRRGCLAGCLVMVLIVSIVGIFTFTTAQRVLAFGSAISTQSPLSTQTGYMSTGDRVNLLVMGYGGGNHDGANLTDSMLVVSLLPPSHHTTLVSVPRDLWIQYPPNSGQYTKINSVYEFGSNNGQHPAAGGDAAAQKVALVTGLDVKYWLTINFDGFRKLIDSIGGVDVYVPDSFTSRYPKNDNPNVDASWITIHFNKGNQHMNGETAIRYARARYITDNLAEGSDFARSARQQIIIKAALAKVKQVSTWPHLYDAMDALKQTIYTNMSLADLTQFALKMDLNDPHTSRVSLSNQNVLVDSNSNDGQYIVVPANNNWQAIVDYIKQHLYN